MKPDYYATLGLSPTSEDVVIRAAYLALMRRYHPDGNPSAAAAARTRAITAAYQVLSDPDRRAEYDQSRGAEAWVNIPVRPLTTLPSGLFAASAILLVLALVLLVVWSPLPMLEPPDRLAHSRGRQIAAAQADPPVLPEVTHVTAKPSAPPAPANQQPAPPVQPLRPPPAAAAPSPAPKVRVAAPARPSLPPAPQPKIQVAVSRPPPPKPPASRPAPVPAAAVELRPSFSCRVARTRGELAVCNSASLANLDRQQALLYSQSLGRADAAKRTQLLGTRERFVARREACKTDSCTSAAYLARMREVSEIMTGASLPPH